MPTLNDPQDRQESAAGAQCPGGGRQWGDCGPLCQQGAQGSLGGLLVWQWRGADELRRDLCQVLQIESYAVQVPKHSRQTGER